MRLAGLRQRLTNSKETLLEKLANAGRKGKAVLNFVAKHKHAVALGTTLGMAGLYLAIGNASADNHLKGIEAIIRIYGNIAAEGLKVYCIGAAGKTEIEGVEINQASGHVDIKGQFLADTCDTYDIYREDALLRRVTDSDLQRAADNVLEINKPAYEDPFLQMWAPVIAAAIIVPTAVIYVAKVRRSKPPKGQLVDYKPISSRKG